MSDSQLKHRYKVEFTLSNKTIEVEEGAYLLDEAVRAGIEMESDCRQGVCGICITTVRGKVEWATEAHCLGEELTETGHVLSCIARVKSDLKVDE